MKGVGMDKFSKIRYLVSDELCKTCQVSLSDINVVYDQEQDEIRVHGHMERIAKEATPRYIEVAVDFLNEEKCILYSTTTLQHGSFKYTGFTTFYLRMGEMKKRMNLDDVACVHLYPFM